MLIAILALIVRGLWIVIEYPCLRRYEIKPVKDWDRHSRKLWDIANALELVGMVFGFTNIGHIPVKTNLIAASGLALLVVGIGIRMSAIRTLGKYFTGTVLIKNDHRLIRSGLDGYLRDPSYTGALIAHVGLGLTFSNWISLGLSVVPFVIAASYRIHVEEQALKEAFGLAYMDYARTTKRLIPGLY